MICLNLLTHRLADFKDSLDNCWPSTRHFKEIRMATILQVQFTFLCLFRSMWDRHSVQKSLDLIKLTTKRVFVVQDYMFDHRVQLLKCNCKKYPSLSNCCNYMYHIRLSLRGKRLHQFILKTSLPVTRKLAVLSEQSYWRQGLTVQRSEQIRMRDRNDICSCPRLEQRIS